MDRDKFCTEEEDEEKAQKKLQIKGKEERPTAQSYPWDFLENVRVPWGPSEHAHKAIEILAQHGLDTHA